eukprot:11624047-Alexandrium_andersonii.AAC.1
MSASLVGSEMCIRDSSARGCGGRPCSGGHPRRLPRMVGPVARTGGCRPCLLYTSDAADDM